MNVNRVTIYWIKNYPKCFEVAQKVTKAAFTFKGIFS